MNAIEPNMSIAFKREAFLFMDEDAWQRVLEYWRWREVGNVASSCKTTYNKLFQVLDDERLQWFRSVRHSPSRRGAVADVHTACDSEITTLESGRRIVSLKTWNSKTMIYWEPKDVTVAKIRSANESTLTSPCWKPLYTTASQSHDSQDLKLHFSRFEVRCCNHYNEFATPDKFPTRADGAFALGPIAEGDRGVLTRLNIEEEDLNVLLSENCSQLFNEVGRNERMHYPNCGAMAGIPLSSRSGIRAARKKLYRTGSVDIETRWMDVKGARIKLVGACDAFNERVADAMCDWLINFRHKCAEEDTCAGDEDEKTASAWVNFKWLPDSLSGFNTPLALREWMKKYFDPEIVNTNGYYVSDVGSEDSSEFYYVPGYTDGSSLPIPVPESTVDNIRFIFGSEIFWDFIIYDVGPKPTQMTNVQTALPPDEEVEEGIVPS